MQSRSMQIKSALKNAKFCNISAASELITLISAKFVYITLMETQQIGASARISAFQNEWLPAVFSAAWINFNRKMVLKWLGTYGEWLMWKSKRRRMRFMAWMVESLYTFHSLNVEYKSVVWNVASGHWSVILCILTENSST